MKRHRQWHMAAAAVVLLAIVGAPRAAFAAGLNTNVALSPPEGGTIVRTQWRYTELSDDPTPLGRDAILSLRVQF